MSKVLYYAERAVDGDVGNFIGNVMSRGFDPGTVLHTDPAGALLEVVHRAWEDGEEPTDEDLTTWEGMLFEVDAETAAVEERIAGHQVTVVERVTPKSVRYVGLTPVDATNQSLAVLPLSEPFTGQILSGVEMRAWFAAHGAPVDDDGKTDPIEFDNWLDEYHRRAREGE
jgi:hypothetical protein